MIRMTIVHVIIADMDGGYICVPIGYNYSGYCQARDCDWPEKRMHTGVTN